MNGGLSVLWLLQVFEVFFLLVLWPGFDMLMLSWVSEEYKYTTVDGKEIELHDEIY
jgi:hypothetical protein